MRRPMMLAGALLALPFLALSFLALSFLAAPVAMAKSHHHKAHSSGTARPNSVAYPGAPGGQPAAADKGKPVMPKGDSGAKPPPPAKASTEGTKGGGVSPPSAAYPGSPVKTPAAESKGGDAPK